MDSPIPGERQIFSRPVEQEPANSLVQGSWSSGGGLPPLPEFPTYPTGSAMQAGMSNPLFGEESAADVAEESEQQAVLAQELSHGVSQPYAAQPQDTADNAQAMNSYSTTKEQADAEELQTEAALSESQDAVSNDDAMQHEYSTPTAAMASTADLVYTHAAPSMLAVPRQSAEASPHPFPASGLYPDSAPASGQNSLHQTRSFTPHTQPEPGPVMQQPTPQPRSARSTAELHSPSPTTPGVTDSSAHGAFDQPHAHAFMPVYPSASRSQAGAAAQYSRPQSASSQPPVYHQGPARRSSDQQQQHMQYMQPAAAHGMYQDVSDQQGHAHSIGEQEYQEEEDDYREQYTAASRPASMQPRQAHGHSQPPRPYSPMPGRVACSALCIYCML